MQLLSAVPPVRLSGFKLPVEHLSASSISQFMTCPEQFRLERIVRVPKRRFLDGFVGSVHHDTVEQNFAQKIHTGTDQSFELMQSAFKYKWAEELGKGEPEWTEHPERVERLGLQMLESFHTAVSPLINPIAVEQRFEERIPGIVVPVVGYIDVEERNLINEFKTAKQKVAKPKPNWRVQGRIYQLVTRKPIYWTVTTKQKTPVNWTWQNAPDLVMEVGNPDVTVRVLAQTVEMMNDCFVRYGPDKPWPLNGLLHTFACDYCSAGPKHPNPPCIAWSGGSSAPVTPEKIEVTA